MQTTLFVLLLTAAYHVEDTPYCLRWLVRPVLRTLALDAEVIDPAELKYLLTADGDEYFPHDVGIIRERWQELADAPPLYDAYRFPEREYINEQVHFNRAFRAHLEERVQFEPWNEWRIHQALEATDDAYHAWDLARDCRCSYYYVPTRKRALHDLRELLGDAAFLEGRLPPIVPLEVCTPIDR